MRHAKSSWAVPGARDFDRELNDRGNNDLELISREIAKKNYIPEKIICSSSVRTRQTLQGIAEVLTPTPEIVFSERLYSGGEEDYLQEIRAAGEYKSVMTIGHNPMSGTLASALVGDGDPKSIETIAYKYPTATISVFDFDISDWSEIKRGTGNLLTCIYPSMLKK